MQQSVDTWLDLIEHRHKVSIDLGLDRIGAVAKKMGLDTGSARVITVAGTNGKGSTCAILESILIQSGYKTGRYSSPHLVDFNERIALSGKNISNQLLIDCFEYVEQCRGEISLSYFEFTTLTAFWSFQQQNLDVWLIEVGLGGRLDASNILDADVAIVTSIALDHKDWLGSDLTVIGHEKAGIFRSQQFAVCGEPVNYQGVTEIAQKLNCQLASINEQYSYQQSDALWSWSGKNHKQESISLNKLPVPGLPVINAATAIQALMYSELNITRDAIVSGLTTVSLPGRLQIIQHGNTEFILDVAHNPHAAKYVVSELIRQQKIPDVMIVAMLSDKDVSGTMDELMLLNCPELYLVTLDEPRGQTSEQMAKYAPGNIKLSHFESIAQAIDDSRKYYKRILICGSFHSVGHAIKYLEGF